MSKADWSNFLNWTNRGAVPQFSSGEWSSYAAILSSQSTKVQRDTVLEWSGGRPQFAGVRLREADARLIVGFDWFCELPVFGRKL